MQDQDFKEKLYQSSKQDVQSQSSLGPEIICEHIQKYNIDEAMIQVGNEGIYQKLMIIYFIICWAWMSNLFSMTSFLFYHQKQDTKIQMNYSIVSDFHIKDDDNFKMIQFGMSVSTIGAVVGNITMNLMSFNRKQLYIICLLVAQLGSIFIFISTQIVSPSQVIYHDKQPQNNNIYLLFTGLFLAGLGSNQLCTLQFTILSEQTSQNYRNITAAGVQLGWSVFSIFAAYIAEYLNDWKTFINYVFVIPSFFLTIPLLLLVNSPNFAFIKDKQEGLKCLNLIAKYNGKEVIQEKQLQDNEINEYIFEKKKQYYLSDLFKFKSIRFNIIKASSLYFIIQMTYYGSVLNQLNIQNQTIYDQIFYGGIVDTCFNLLASFLSLKCQRKIVLFISYILITISQLSTVFFKNQNSPYILVVNLFSRGLLALCCDFMILYVEEIFPTCIKNVAIGFYFGFGLSGGIVSSYIVFLDTDHTLVIFGCISIVGLFIITQLRETQNKRIYHQIKEIEKRNTSFSASNHNIQIEKTN